jgi:hypothetical protein
MLPGMLPQEPFGLSKPPYIFYAGIYMSSFMENHINKTSPLILFGMRSVGLSLTAGCHTTTSRFT